MGTMRAAALAVLAVTQLSFEQSLAELKSPDASTRLKSVQALKGAAYPEAAVPLAAVVNDPQDQIQLEAIAAELNIFLAEKVVPRQRLGFVVELRESVSAEAAFSSGPLAVGARPVPPEVLAALLIAIRDDNPRVGLEALYTFGVLGVVPTGEQRRELLRTSGPELAALLGRPDPAVRYAAARVIGRVFAKRADDGPVDEATGDAVIVALNDKDRVVYGAALEALGAMRYDRAVQALTDLFTFHAKGVQAAAALDALARIANPASAPLFLAQLRSPTTSFRGTAAEGLARVGDKSALAEIQSALSGERSDAVQLAVSFASAMLADGSIDRIAEALVKPRLRDQARQYLLELARGRSTLFVRLVKDPDPRVRVEAVDAVALARDPAALALVEPLVNDGDPAVARAATRAVAWLGAVR
jgi:HEAT repeat protein